MSLVRWATCTAPPATRAASLVFWAISRMLAPISSAPVATVCTLRDTWSAAAATTSASEAVRSAEAEMAPVMPVSDPEESLTARALPRIVRMMPATVSSASFVDRAIRDTSSCPVTSSRPVRSPAATAAITPAASPSGRVMLRGGPPRDDGRRARRPRGTSRT